jgi:hypothetical protein
MPTGFYMPEIGFAIETTGWYDFMTPDGYANSLGFFFEVMDVYSVDDNTFQM